MIQNIDGIDETRDQNAEIGLNFFVSLKIVEKIHIFDRQWTRKLDSRHETTKMTIILLKYDIYNNIHQKCDNNFTYNKYLRQN
jgi:hypothetical protein